MPKHYGRKKRTFRKRTKKTALNKKQSVPRSLKMQSYNFCRDVESDIDLSRIEPNGNGPLNLWYTNDGGIAGSYGFTFRMLPNFTEFAPLFKQYRIVAVSTYIYPSANSFQAGTGVSTLNNNMMIRLAYNQSGTAIGTGNTVEDWNQLQAKKRWIIRPNKKIQLYTKLKQRNVVQGDTALAPLPVQYTLQSPRFIDTIQNDVLHLGHNIRFDSLDPALPMETGNDFWPHLKVIQKIYFQCKGVK